MDEIETLRAIGRDVPSDTQADSRARERLLQHMETPSPLRRRPVQLTRRSLAIAATALLLPAGIAIGAVASGDSEISGGQSVTAAECPEASEVFAEAGLPAPKEYAETCPNDEQIAEFKALLESAIRGGWSPDASTEP